MKKILSKASDFRWIVCWLLTAMLCGCLTSSPVPYRSVREPVPVEFFGDWVFAILYHQRGSLQVTDKKIVLSLSGDQGRGLVEAAYVGKNAQGFDEFRFKHGAFTNMRTPSRMWRDYQAANGFVIYQPYPGHRNPLKRYNFHLTQDGVPIRGFQGNMYPLGTANNTGRLSISGSTARGYFLYNGPAIQKMPGDRFFSTMNVHESSRLVKAMIDRTVRSGINCGNVVNAVVRPGELRRINLPADFSGTLIKLVSPLGSGRLIYGIGSTTSAYGSVNTPQNGFPTIVARNFTGKPFIDLFVFPEVESGLYKQAEIPVSLYYFNRRLVVNRKGCEFLETSTFQKSFALGKLYFAILMEKNRRDGAVDGNMLKQYISIYGRDLSLASALQDVFPSANNSAISYMVRNIGSVMEKGFDSEQLVVANSREAILQEIESQPGMKGQGLRYLDILLDIQFRRSSSL